MLSPADLIRLAVRIEALERQSTHGWMPGDALEFQNGLPNSRVTDPRRKLPNPTAVREGSITFDQYQGAVQICWRLESLANYNRPNNPRRIMHDMARGKFPR